MWGLRYWAKNFWAQNFWPQGAAVPAATEITHVGGYPAGKKKKHKPVEDTPWTELTAPQIVAEEPEPETETIIEAAPSVAFQKPELSAAWKPKRSKPGTAKAPEPDPFAESLKRMQQEMDDEEVLFRLGAFDD